MVFLYFGVDSDSADSYKKCICENVREKKHRTYILLSDGVISISVEPLHDVVRLPITFYVWENSKKGKKG